MPLFVCDFFSSSAFNSILFSFVFIHVQFYYVCDMVHKKNRTDTHTKSASSRLENEMCERCVCLWAHAYIVYGVCAWTTGNWYALRCAAIVSHFYYMQKITFLLYMQFAVLWLFDDRTVLILHFSFHCHELKSTSRWRGTDKERERENELKMPRM